MSIITNVTCRRPYQQHSQRRRQQHYDHEQQQQQQQQQETVSMMNDHVRVIHAFLMRAPALTHVQLRHMYNPRVPVPVALMDACVTPPAHARMAATAAPHCHYNH